MRSGLERGTNHLSHILKPITIPNELKLTILAWGRLLQVGLDCNLLLGWLS